jgi:uncharacterized protein YdeI (YjbR/CyaY-like superfamily)
MADELELLTFADAAAFSRWLGSQPDGARGAWLRFAKKGAPQATLSKSEAIDCALANGWIDGQLGRVDEAYFKVRFTPRTARSPWSQVNRKRAEVLIRERRMTARGLAEVERAKADGRWAAAYPPQSKAEVPDELRAALAACPAARRSFEALDSANRYAVLYRVHQAKTRAAREAKIVKLVEMLARGETFHPRRAKRS